MTTVVLPLNITFREWASQIRIDLPNVTFPIPPTVEYWRGWASAVVNGNMLQNVPIPTEIGYPNNEDWKKWAAYFVSSVYT